MRCVTYSKKEKDIVEKGIAPIREVLLGTDDNAKYAVDMYKMWKTEALVLEECVKILQENEMVDNSSNMGTFPKSAIIVLNTEGNEDGDGYDNPDTIEGIWEIADGKCSARRISRDGIPRLRSPVSGAYYPVGEFYFNVKMREKAVYLSYIFGPRFGRGFTYQIQTNEETGEIQALIKPQVLWTM